MDNDLNVTEKYTELYNISDKNCVVAEATERLSNNKIKHIRPVVIGIDLCEYGSNVVCHKFMSIIAEKDCEIFKFYKPEYNGYVLNMMEYVDKKSEDDYDYEVDESRPRIKLLMQAMNM